jgi:hypothetical protein
VGLQANLPDSSKQRLGSRAALVLIYYGGGLFQGIAVLRIDAIHAIIFSQPVRGAT